MHGHKNTYIESTKVTKRKMQRETNSSNEYCPNARTYTLVKKSPWSGHKTLILIESSKPKNTLQHQNVVVHYSQ